MNEELISIIVPVYNVEAYIHQCIKSIIEQSYKNLEIILVDDGSKDKSGKICDDYARKDKRIKVIHKKNGGLSDSRNAGITVATGKYIAFVDSDDWIEKNMYEKMYNECEKFGADICICGFFREYKDKTISECNFGERVYDTESALEELIKGRVIKDHVQNILNDKKINICADKEKNIYGDHQFHIVSVGSIKPIKGYERLIKVHRALKNEGVKCVHYILGDGPSYADLKQKITENDLEDRIILKGYIENPYPWIKEADMLACVSYAEGYSSVVCEAVILGVPVITTECSGMKDILGDSEYGLIVKNDDISIINGIKKMVTNKEFYQKYLLKVKERRTEFSVDNAVKQLKTKLEI